MGKKNYVCYWETTISDNYAVGDAPAPVKHYKPTVTRRRLIEAYSQEEAVRRFFFEEMLLHDGVLPFPVWKDPLKANQGAVCVFEENTRRARMYGVQLVTPALFETFSMKKQDVDTLFENARASKKIGTSDETISKKVLVRLKDRLMMAILSQTPEGAEPSLAYAPHLKDLAQELFIAMGYDLFDKPIEVVFDALGHGNYHKLEEEEGKKK